MKDKRLIVIMICALLFSTAFILFDINNNRNHHVNLIPDDCYTETINKAKFVTGIGTLTEQMEAYEKSNIFVGFKLERVIHCP